MQKSHCLLLIVLVTLSLLISSQFGENIWAVIIGFTSDGTVKSFQKISDTSGDFDPGNDGGTLGNSDFFGDGVTSIGDLDGDGIEDIAVGVVGDDDGTGANSGAAYVLFLNTNGKVKSSQKISNTTGGFAAVVSNGQGLTSGDQFGRSIASIGDLDGDGVTDIVVGANQDEDGGTANGAVFVLFMDSDGTIDDVKAPQKISEFFGDFDAGNDGGSLDDSDAFGSAVANIGDLDDDGITDIVVTALSDDDAGSAAGAVYILFLGTDGKVDGSQKITEGVGDFTGDLDSPDFFGAGLAGIGDLNNDGIEDIAVGAIADDDGFGGGNRGAVYIIFLETDGTVKESLSNGGFQKISDTEGGFTGTLANGDNFGASIANLGDLNNDGVQDLAVGARDDTGSVWILFMNTDGTVQSSQKITENVGGFTGDLDSGDNFADTIASIGDLDRDGITDIVVGSDSDDDGNTDRGAVYVLFLNGNLIEGNPSGGNTCYDCKEPSFTDRFSDDEYPLSINSNNFTLPNRGNYINTTTITTGKSVELKLLMYENGGPNNISHVALYTDFEDTELNPEFSNTNIVWHNNEISSHDPNENILNYTVKTQEKNDKFEIIFNVIFAKPIGVNDIVIRAWDSNNNGINSIIYDALEIVGKEVTEPEIQFLRVEPKVIEPFFDNEEKSLILERWAGYYAESAIDTEVLQTLGYEGTYIPHWVKKTFGEGIHHGYLTIDELTVVIDYLSQNGILK